jgi:hypothetical protein
MRGQLNPELCGTYTRSRTHKGKKKKRALIAHEGLRITARYNNNEKAEHLPQHAFGLSKKGKRFTKELQRRSAKQKREEVRWCLLHVQEATLQRLQEPP